MGDHLRYENFQLMKTKGVSKERYLEMIQRIRDERKEIETERKREEAIDSKETENKVEIESIEKVGGKDKEIIEYLEGDEQREEI